MQNRKKGVRFISRVRELLPLHLCRIPPPSILSFFKPLNTPPSLSDHFLFPSAFTFLSVPSHPSYFSGRRLSKWNFFTEHARIQFKKKEEAWTKRGRMFMKYWRRLLQPFVACHPSLSSCINVFMCVHVWALSYVYIYLSVFASPELSNATLLDEYITVLWMSSSSERGWKWNCYWSLTSPLSLLLKLFICQWVLSLQMPKTCGYSSRGWDWLHLGDRMRHIAVAS